MNTQKIFEMRKKRGALPEKFQGFSLFYWAYYFDIIYSIVS